MKDDIDNNHPQKEIVPNKLVTLATFKGREEAYLSRGKLQSEGIVSFVIGDHLPGAMGNSVIQLQVKLSNLAEAKRILDETSPKCPICNASDIIDIFPYFKKNLRLKCKKCGYEWKTEQSGH